MGPEHRFGGKRATLRLMSVDGLNADDPGIALLAEAIRGASPSEVLLVHCGDLPGLGPGAERLILDVRERQRAIATCVDEQLGPVPLSGRARHGIVWPRAHLGKDFTRWSIARAVDGVGEGGAVWCTVRKSKGADSIADALRTMVGPVDVVERSKGYRLLRAERGADVDARVQARRDALEQRYAIQHSAIGDVTLASAPGVFSRRALDAGTEALLRQMAERVDTVPRHIVDLCCGIGPIAIAAARRFVEARVTAVDSNLIASALARHNTDESGVSDRVEVLTADGLPDRGERPPVDLALVNPPTHADADVLRVLLRGLWSWMAEGGRALFVVSRPGTLLGIVGELGAKVETVAAPKHTLVWARRS